MSTTRLPELPFLSPALGYEVQDKVARDMIREYAAAYGLAVWKAAMEAMKVVAGVKPRDREERDLLGSIWCAIRSIPEPAIIQQERTE